MFSNTRRKKTRSRVLFASIGIILLIFGLWLNFRNDDGGDAAEDAINNIKAEQSEETSEAAEPQKENTDNQEETSTSQPPESYLIKEVNGVVKVFICDEDDNQELYLITSIPFDLLSENDQQLFIDGVYVQTEEDLGKFLENFDS